MFRCTWWLYSGQVFQLCNAKYETVLNTDIYCGLEIKNSGSSSGIDFRYLEQRKKHPVQFETFGYREWALDRRCNGGPQADLQLSEQQREGQAGYFGYLAGTRCFLSGK